MSGMHESIKQRFERLLSGGRNAEDLTKIFIYLRSRCTGPIREIGDYIAHFDKRDRGDTIKELVDFLTIKKLMFRCAASHPHMHDGKDYFNFDDMPSDFAEGFRKILRVVGVEELASVSGLPVYKVPIVLNSIIDKAKKKPDGSMSLHSQLIDLTDELCLVGVLFRSGRRINLYDLNMVFSELISEAERRNLIKRADRRATSLREYVGLYICASMDNCKIRSSGFNISLQTRVSTEGKINVMAKTKIYKSATGGTVTYLAPVFWADIDASIAMSPQAMRRLQGRSDHSGTLEVNSLGKLDFV